MNAVPDVPLTWPDADAVRQWQQRLRRAGERRLLLVEAEPSLARAYAARLCQGLAEGRRLWVGDAPAINETTVTVTAARHATRWLGRELDLVIWDGWQGNPPDSLAALMGTLGAGAVFVWLMPPVAHWPDFADPDYPRTGLEQPGPHPFLARMADILTTSPAVVRLGAGGEVTGSLALPLPDRPFEPAGTPEQQATIEAIRHTGAGRRRRPLVVRADRGRGKSTALGRAAAALLQDKWDTVLVTAPRPEAVEQLFVAAQADWPGAVRDGHVLRREGRSLRFLPADVLLRERPEAGLVLVDEAAGLPAPLLEAILTGWPRVVFSTTVHGYEGTGRGFDVRFRDVLDRQTPQWQRIALSQPIRWADGDPFETLVNRLFLLDARSATGARTDAALQLESVRPDQLDTETLGAAFGLLTDAHYRTTPGDLRQWLDDTRADSWLARAGGAAGPVVGVLWVTREGNLSAPLAQAVMQGKRRLRGHLLPQSLASHGGIADAATLNVARVVRIAVLPEWRRRGVGRALLEAARKHATAQGIDLFGTSFGATQPLLDFWRQSGMTPLRLGLHQSASSGEHTLQMARGCSDAGQALVARLTQRYAAHWPLLLTRDFADLPAALVLALSQAWSGSARLDAMDRAELAAFAEGYRLFELSLLALRRLALQPGVAEVVGQTPEADLWCRAILQDWPWAQLQSAGACQGRRDGEDRLRALTRQVLERVDTVAH